MSNFLQTSMSEVAADVSIGRSVFPDCSYVHQTTMTEGDLCPMYLQEVLPGDSFKIDTSFLLRMSTPIYPVIGNCYVDIFYFFVPNRLVWSHWREFCGENTTAPWTQTTEYTVPQIKFGYYSHVVKGNNNYTATGAVPGSVMNYFGVPCSLYPDSTYVVGTSPPKNLDFSVSDLPNRAYRLIWNEFFRSESIQYPVAVYTDDSDRDYHLSASLALDYGGHPLKVNRYFDYFSACLPAPQRGPAVSAGLLDDNIPVIPTSDHSNASISGFEAMHHAFSSQYNSGFSSSNMGSNVIPFYNTVNQSKGSPGTAPSGNSSFYAPDNLHAIASQINIASVNQLREAFAIQRFYELEARTGTRYRSILKAFFGVTSPDARVQVPEYLGGCRRIINMDQVLQTSSTDNTSPQGNTAAYSLTTGSDGSVNKSFVEHGMIIGVAAIRVDHTYNQAVYPFLFRKRRFDFYWPQFANLGEQPVLKKCLCPTGISEIDNTVFGYQEAYADYRYRFNEATGDFSSLSYYDNSGAGVCVEEQSQLAQAWTYGDHYDMNFQTFYASQDLTSLTPVTLSSSWLTESDVNVGQTLAVQSEPQFICDWSFDVRATRPLPVHSVPGLIDHH